MKFTESVNRHERKIKVDWQFYCVLNTFDLFYLKNACVDNNSK